MKGSELDQTIGGGFIGGIRCSGRIRPSFRQIALLFSTSMTIVSDRITTATEGGVYNLFASLHLQNPQSFGAPSADGISMPQSMWQ